jgi:hypothetical protein
VRDIERNELNETTNEAKATLQKSVDIEGLRSSARQFQGWIKGTT